MKVRAKPAILDAHQWFPDKPHPRVYTNRSAVSSTLHPELSAKLRNSKGRCGVVRVPVSAATPDPDRGFRLVSPGDWIVTDEDGVDDWLTDAGFQAKYEPIAEG